MSIMNRLSLSEIESRVCDIAAEQMGLCRSEVHSGLRLIQDLHCDSLDAVELLMEVEDEFDVALPNEPPNMAYKAVFTREQFRLRDLAELVYLQQGCGRIKQNGRRSIVLPLPTREMVPLTQLGARLAADSCTSDPLFESLGNNRQGFAVHRRRADGMICVRLPGGGVVLGADGDGSMTDEHPRHRAKIDGFLIDQEPVSTTAFCRFLNSIGTVPEAVLQEWFILTPQDNRCEHALLRQEMSDWMPLPGTERMPMILVSWYGANAYSLWANRGDWQAYRDDESGGQSFLPSEAQWEYAARGDRPRKYPWGDHDATPELMRYGQHARGRTYRPETLPLSDVNAELGMSPFGLHHMAGNIWQWCRDWYAPDFYATAEASAPNPVNRNPTQIRSERGGSWIGPAFLCRSSYRRGRVPAARGRCLGFRCVSESRDANGS